MSEGDAWVSELQSLAASAGFGGRVALSYPLGPLTTYKLGGPAEAYVEVESERDLESLASLLAEHPDVQVTIVGRGSNILVSDKGVKGLVLRLGEGFHYIEEVAGGVRAGGIVPLPVLARWVGERGYTGLEFGVGIPASVGGAVRMNAGGHGSEISEVLRSARIFDLTSGGREVAAQDLGLRYRGSDIGPQEIVVEATFDLKAGDPEKIKAAMAEISRWRREHQPGGIPSAGSVFKNPPGDAAGRLIEAAGCKGLRVGGAEVSRKHANFFVAEEGAAASDVAGLMVEVRRRVFEKFEVLLEPEVRLIGDFGELREELERSPTLRS